MLFELINHLFELQPQTSDDVIQSDRQSRQTAIKSGKRVATAPKIGFFGTIFNLIVQVGLDFSEPFSILLSRYIKVTIVFTVVMFIHSKLTTPKARTRKYQIW